MMCIHITFSKSDYSTPLHALHLPTKDILLAVNPFHCLFAKSSPAFCKKAVERVEKKCAHNYVIISLKSKLAPNVMYLSL